jgi:hypothetical protein
MGKVGGCGSGCGSGGEGKGKGLETIYWGGECGGSGGLGGGGSGERLGEGRVNLYGGDKMRIKQRPTTFHEARFQDFQADKENCGKNVGNRVRPGDGNAVLGAKRLKKSGSRSMI